MVLKNIGMIGGLGPESTIDYYNLIIKGYRKEISDGSQPEIIIYSMNMMEVLKLVAEEDWDKLIVLLLKGVHNLYKAGANFAFISSNTPHVVFDQVQKESPIPLISIVEETYKIVKEKKIKKVGLMGTRYTMSGSYYQKVFEKGDIEIVVPKLEEQSYLEEKLMKEIEYGVLLEETKKGLMNIAHRMFKEDEIEGIILGCTELPLIISEDEDGLTFFNTTRIHVDGILRLAISE